MADPKVEPKDSCVKPAKGIIAAEGLAVPQPLPEVMVKEAPKMLARIGKPAPDFEASAFFEGGFKNVKLSDYKGHWVVVCFYPGDFTFV